MSDQSIEEAARDFVRAWGELATSLPDDYECHMTCTEADTLAELFAVLGETQTAASIIFNHAAHDEPGDTHYQGGGS